MQGSLLRPAELAAMRTTTAASSSYGLGIELGESGCAGLVYQRGGAHELERLQDEGYRREPARMRSSTGGQCSLSASRPMNRPRCPPPLSRRNTSAGAVPVAPAAAKT
jgi:hypothetical protein